MAKKKIYAVKRGKKTGIFKSWDECKILVSGYPGAEYKGFFTEEEANEYLSGTVKDVLNNTSEKGEECLTSSIVAYVDGSFDKEIGKYAFGCVIITPNNEVIRESGNGEDSDLVAFRNVSGEIMGAMFAVEWCEKNGYSAIKLCYDYLGIEKWATGEWEATNVLTKKYVEFMNEMGEKLNISFQKIEAHTGNKYNEEADKLAKSALIDKNSTRQIKKGDFWFAVNDISWSELETIIVLAGEEFGKERICKEEKPFEYGHSINLKLDNKEKIVITHYDKGNKLVMQGRPQQLFSTILSYVTELVDVENIPQIFNETYKLNIDKKEVNVEFRKYMPNAYDKLPEKMLKTLHQAVYNLMLDGDMFEVTFLAFPALRAIDAHLKMLLWEYGIVSDKWKIGKIKYRMFTKENKRYVLCPENRGKATDEQAEYIGRCYKYFHDYRNNLFHWDNPIAPEDTTKLYDIQKTRDIIKEGLALIDEFYE